MVATRFSSYSLCIFHFYVLLPAHLPEKIAHKALLKGLLTKNKDAFLLETREGRPLRD